MARRPGWPSLIRAGFRVPPGFCIPVAGYDRFVKAADLATVVRLALGRKPLEAMRWEELWDTALRIRSAFLAAPIPTPLAAAITGAVEALGAGVSLAVRSSAPGEDSATGAFAGIHESVVGLIGGPAVLEAVKVVWASLWSDAALLYRRELGLDPSRSRMAVLVQAMVTEDRSGVAFGRDPREVESRHAIVEAVAGPCGDLVDGRVDPDRWILDRSSGTVVEWRLGARVSGATEEPLLAAPDLSALHRVADKRRGALRLATGRGVDRPGASADAPAITTHHDGGSRRTRRQARVVSHPAAGPSTSARSEEAGRG